MERAGLRNRGSTNLALVLQVLAELAGHEVPDLNEAVYRARDEVLSIRAEAGALAVVLRSEL